jgi:hypothetical protein
VNERYQLDRYYESAKVLLLKAEQLFLEREATEPFLGVRVDPKGPHLRFEPEGRPGVWVELSPSTLQYPDQALHQIAHEVIHLLAPTRCPPTIMLEEGLAVWFSLHGPAFSDARYKLEAITHIYAVGGPINYRDALDLYNELLAVDQNAVVALRGREPRLWSLKPSLIQETLRPIDPNLATRLCERREMRP